MKKVLITQFVCGIILMFIAIVFPKRFRVIPTILAILGASWCVASMYHWIVETE